ncbi:TPM domain-containing protein [Pseudoduganella sp. GCM10020061]|uniref:TPM domain-containing protein n=1 Tax=Pseudoduganella sp. GCM10020061 TaxID=3317345 RepID=UPI0036409707
MPMLRVLLLAVFALWMGAASAQQLVPVPELKGRVNDNASMLTPAQRTQLETVLADYEKQTGNQIVILTVSKTEPEAIEQYSIRVVEAWKLGRKGIDDGVLLMVAKDNPSSLRRLRIEAGRGVQGVLTDAQSKRILQDVIAPHFRQSQYYDGMVAGVSAIAALLRQEQLPAPAREAERAAVESDGGPSWPFILFGVLIAMSILRSRGGRRGRVRRGGWSSGATGFILGNAIGAMTSRGHHGGFGGLGGGGGFSGGGGGFSGGGGTFDGGGASGDW